MHKQKPSVNSIHQSQEQIDNANHTVTIVWGTCEDTTETYGFDNEDEDITEK